MRVRTGGPDDVGAVLALFDEAVRWLVARGREGQWGSAPFSSSPERIAQARGWGRDGGLWIAEADGMPVGAMVLGAAPAYVPAAAEPELYVLALVASREHPAGRGAGRLLLDQAYAQTDADGLALFRVDCWAGGDGALVRYYQSVGFTPTDRFVVGGWQGQVLERRVAARRAAVR